MVDDWVDSKDDVMAEMRVASKAASKAAHWAVCLVDV